MMKFFSVLLAAVLAARDWDNPCTNPDIHVPKN